MAMSRDQFLSAIHRPGAFQRATWTSNPTPAKAKTVNAGVTLTKVTSATVITGADYSDVLFARAGVESTGAGIWHGHGEYVTPRYVVRHTGTGREYAVLFLAMSGGDGEYRPLSVTSKYYVNGESVTRETFDKYLPPARRSDAREYSPTGILMIPLDSLTLA